MAKKFNAPYDALGLKAPAKDSMTPREKADLIFHAACKKLGLDPAGGPQVHQLPERFQVFPVAAFRLQVIHEAVVGEEKKDWDDYGQVKYGCWHLMNKPGFRFCDVVYSYARASTGLGSRLCTLEEEAQEFIAVECVAYCADFHEGQLPA
jgi:hypothetical protein